MTSSSSRLVFSFLGDAISTAASPLRNSFIELNCRSPITPRRSFNLDRSQGLAVNTAHAEAGEFSDVVFPHTPIGGVFETPRLQSTSFKNHNNGSDISKSSSTVVSPGSSENLLLRTSVRHDDLHTNKLGTFSAINMILGKTVGVGIYSIPASVYVSVGSVGMTLVMWILGALLSFCGLAVYLELGTAIPRSGGERVYLERIFRRPYMLATCMFMAYVVLLGFSAPSCIVLGQYALYALKMEPNRWNVRIIAVAVITLLCTIHSRSPRLGLSIINILGIGKMLILAIVILSGFAGMTMRVGSHISSIPTDTVVVSSTARRNFSNLFINSSTQPYDYATALLKVLYCFRGYSTANSILSSIRDPIPTLKIAAPVALSLVSLLYVFFVISLFLVVELADFKSTGIIITGHFFRNVFGEILGERILPCLIIISAFGNIAATSFAQARVNQELGKDGLLPFSSFFAGRSPRRGSTAVEEPPTPGLLLHWLISVAVIVIPPGEIYNFLVDIGGYPVSVMSVSISAGLLYLQLAPRERWRSPFRARKRYIFTFFVSNCLLLVLPWIKPAQANKDSTLPYYAYPLTALAILTSGICYWIWWARLPPHLMRHASNRLSLWTRRRKISGDLTFQRHGSFAIDTRRRRQEMQTLLASESLVADFTGWRGKDKDGVERIGLCECEGCRQRRRGVTNP